MSQTTLHKLRQERAVQYAKQFTLVKVEESFYDAERGKWRQTYIIPETPLSLPTNLAYHTSLKLKDGSYLFAIDVDSPDVFTGWRVVQTILSYTGQDFFIKHSGNKGFHMLAKFEKDALKRVEHRGFTSIEQYAKSVIMDICKGINGVTQATISQPEAAKSGITFLDVSLHNSNHLLRGLYSYHPKSGCYSIPVDKTWSVNMILHARQKTNMLVTQTVKVDFPVFMAYALGTDVQLIPPDKVDTEFDIDDVEVDDDIAKVVVNFVQQDGPPCIQQALNKNGDVGHALRFHTTLFLKNNSFGYEHIMIFWKSVLSEEKYYHFLHEEEQSLQMLFSKTYASSCEKILHSGICVGKCKYYGVRWTNNGKGR